MLKFNAKNNEYGLIFLYLAYLITALILFIIFTSVSTFFHFLLQHELSVIENWLNHNKIIFIICSKFLSFLFWFNIIKINRGGREKLFQTRFISFKNIDWYLVLTLCSLLSMLFFVFRLDFNDTFSISLDQGILAILGGYLFYVIDFYFLGYVLNFSKKFSLLAIIVLSVLFSFSLFNIVGHMKHWIILHSFIFFILSVSFFYGKKESWLSGLVLLFVLNLAFFIIHPLHFFSGHESQLLSLSEKGSLFPIVVICILCGIYYVKRVKSFNKVIGS